MEPRHRSWTAAVRLAVVISIVAGVAAAAVSLLGEVPQPAVVLPVIVVAFTASWVRTGRIHRAAAAPVAARSARHTARTT